MTEKTKIVFKYMIKNDKTFQIIKRNRNYHQQISRKKGATNYRFRYRGANSVGPPYG